MTSAEIVARRLRSHGLATAPFAEPEQVVGWLGAVQSQEHEIAKWSVGQRAAGLVEADLDRALARGSILRTHVLRPTWHFVLPADIRWMLELTAPRVHAMNGTYYRKFELDGATLARTTRLVASALEGGRSLTRREIAKVLLDAGIHADALRMGYVLMYAELERVTCSGPPRGKQRTYALLDERAPPARPRDPDEALAELTERYFTSHGPATARDFRWWSSLTAADAKRGLAMAGAGLASASVDGVPYWFGEAAPEGRGPEPAAHLLQGYDEYIVGYRESKGVLAGEGLKPLDGMPFLHAVILDGRVVGHWRRALGRARAALELQPRKELGRKATVALKRAAERYGRFVGLPVAL